MSSAARTIDRGTRLGERSLAEIGREFLDARSGLGVSQEHIAQASRVSRPRYSRIENGKARTLQVLEVFRISAVLGLQPSLRLFPGGRPVRDAAHSHRLRRVLEQVAAPLKVRIETPLPPVRDRLELRAWDATIVGEGERTAFELEVQLHDNQALERRIALKRRDDPPDGFVLLIADTRSNRRILQAEPQLFADLPRLPARLLYAALRAGKHPDSALVLV